MSNTAVLLKKGGGEGGGMMEEPEKNKFWFLKDLEIQESFRGMR